MATLIHRSPHQWQAKVRRKGYPLVSKPLDTKAGAKRWARLVESEMDHGPYVWREEAGNTTLAEALERYARESSPRNKGARQERDRIAVLKKHDLAHRSLAGILGADIAGYRDERLEAGKSPITVNNELIVILTPSRRSPEHRGPVHRVAVVLRPGVRSATGHANQRAPCRAVNRIHARCQPPPTPHRPMTIIVDSRPISRHSRYCAPGRICAFGSPIREMNGALGGLIFQSIDILSQMVTINRFELVFRQPPRVSRCSPTRAGISG